MAAARKRGGVAGKLLQKATQKKAAKKASPPKPLGLAVGDVVVWRRAYPNDWLERRKVLSIKRTASESYIRVTISDSPSSEVFSWNVSQRRGRHGSSFHVQIIEPLTPELDETISAQMLIANASQAFEPTSRLRVDLKIVSHMGVLSQLKNAETVVAAKLADLHAIAARAQSLLEAMGTLRRKAKHLT